MSVGDYSYEAFVEELDHEQHRGIDGAARGRQVIARALFEILKRLDAQAVEIATLRKEVRRCAESVGGDVNLEYVE